MNWHILSVASDLKERETGKTMTEDEMGALFWTLGLQFDELEPHEMERGLKRRAKRVTLSTFCNDRSSSWC